MNALRTILRELLGLFVDDGSFALQILVWLALTAFLLPHLNWIPARVSNLRGIILFLGLAAILMTSAIRYSRRNQT